MSCQSCSQSCHTCTNSPHCGGCHGCGASAPLNEQEKALLLELAQTPFLPLSQFSRRESYFSPLEPLNPSPIYLRTGTETTAEIELTSLALRRLASRGYITLDYDVPLSGYDYLLYRQSAFAKRQAQLYPNETIVAGRGSMALTAAGQEAADDPNL